MVKRAGNVAPLPCVVMWATLRHFLVWRAENLESWRDSAVVWYGACPLVGCLGAIKPNPHESHDPPTREVELAGVPMEQGHMSSWAVVAGLGFLVVAFSAVTKVYE